MVKAGSEPRRKKTDDFLGKNQLLAILGQFKDAILITDCQRNVVYLNDAACQLLEAKGRTNRVETFAELEDRNRRLSGRRW